MRIITLIHGTWARGARWTQDDSPLVMALKKADPEACIERLQWSGGNSHAARLAAAEKLVYHIKDCRNRYPAAKHYVIAHSHGGNVVRYALSLREVSADLRGVVCLSTPFIICLRKPEGKELWPRLLSLLALGYVFGFRRLFFLVGAPVLFLLFVVALGPGRIYRRWERIPLTVYSIPCKITDWSFLNSLEGANPSPSKLLIIRPSGDEAATAIGVFQLLTRLSNRAAKWVNRLYVKAGTISFVSRMNRKLRWWAGALMFFAGFVFTFKGALPLIKDISHAWGLLLFIGAVTISVSLLRLSSCFMHPKRDKSGQVIWDTLDLTPVFDFLAGVYNGVLSLLFFPLIAITSLFTVAFGWDMPFFSLFLQFSVEPLPPVKDPSVFQLPLQDIPGLSHSQPYNNPDAIAEIIRWIKRDELDPA